MSDLYLKVTNDINEDVLLCYIYSNTGACYGLKYSPNDTNQLSIVVLNSRQTAVESEQNGAESHKLYKDDLVHIYTDTSQGIGRFLVSSIHNGEESGYPSPFVLQAKEGIGRVDFDNEPFSFAGLKITNFSETSNTITEITSYEYESKINISESSFEEESSQRNEEGSEKNIKQPSSEENEDSTKTSESTFALTTVSTVSNDDSHSSFNGKPFIIGAMILTVVLAVLLTIKKLGIIYKISNLIRKDKNNNKHTAVVPSKISVEFIECQVINQSYHRDNKKLLSHSLFKREDSERDFDIKLAQFKDYEYYRDQNGLKVKYRKLYSTAKFHDSAFIIAMTKEWELVIAQHNSPTSLTLDVFNENYLLKVGMGINGVCQFLSDNIREYQYDQTDINAPASSFFRLLSILISQYAKDVYANDSRIASIRKDFLVNKSKWDELFKKEIPSKANEAVITISELFFMKNISTREISFKWEELVSSLQAIKRDIDSRIQVEIDNARIQPQSLSTRPQSTSYVNQNPTAVNVTSFSPSITSASSLPPQHNVIIDPVQHYVPPPTSQLQSDTLSSVGEMYVDAARYFSNKIPPDFCKPASDVTAYHITSPYKLTIISNKSRPAIPEFILIGNNLFPNPYRFKNGIIKVDEINRIILDAVFDIDRRSTGTIKHIKPAKVNLDDMIVVEKGCISFTD